MRQSNRITIVWNLWNFLVVLISTRLKFDFNFQLCEITICTIYGFWTNVRIPLTQQYKEKYSRHIPLKWMSRFIFYDWYIFDMDFPLRLSFKFGLHQLLPSYSERADIFIDEFMRTDKILAIHGKAQRFISATSPMVTY